jgi:hypothetical protein
LTWRLVDANNVGKAGRRRRERASLDEKAFFRESHTAMREVGE